LVRTSQNELNIDGKYQYEQDGSGAYAFVLDTGIYIGHDDFNGRASWGANCVDKDDFDGNGHGTHCAGTIGGTQYGLAKRCRLVAVKVLSASGSGSWSGVIEGINYVANDSTRRPATINMSLGGGKQQAVNDAVDAASNHGLVTVVVASGNDNGNTCNYSPGSAPTAISVGASDNTDKKASFSNHGECMNVFAPGVGVTSTWIGAPDAVNTISGTSMASPHVCGVVTKYLGDRQKDTPAVVKAWILDMASGNLVTGVPDKTPNLLLNNMCAQSVNTSTVKLSKRY
jgi:subtilisin family serine protease